MNNNHNIPPPISGLERSSRDSEIKIKYHSSRGPKFGSQHQEMTPHNTTPGESNTSCLCKRLYSHAYSLTQANRDIMRMTNFNLSAEQKDCSFLNIGIFLSSCLLQCWSHLTVGFTGPFLYLSQTLFHWSFSLRMDASIFLLFYWDLCCTHRMPFELEGHKHSYKGPSFNFSKHTFISWRVPRCLL